VVNDLLDKKINLLHAHLQKYMPMAIAFSGGVDSTFLLAEAFELAEVKRQVVAVTADSPIHPRVDLESAKAFCSDRGIRHIIVQSAEMDSQEFTSNPANRCYICKKIIFLSVMETLERLGIKHVAHAVNVDDLSEYRPGLKAADEMGLLAPLVEAGLSKSDIRDLSRKKGLPTWDKPSSGCLATRIPYGNIITKAKLDKIESAEHALAELGFSGCRVRYYDDLAKIEIQPGDFEKIMDAEFRGAIAERLKKIGFLYVSVDIEGYASGRLNRSIQSL
jgi:pyridinium-3,5-biscarboxylic acid mononucleotide sulfurtransferase